MFARYGQFKANLYQQNPTDAGFFPLSGSNRYGMSIAGDAVWIMSNKTTLNVRGSFYNMTDEFYNPSLAARRRPACRTTGRRSWHSSLYNSGYVYYPGARRDHRHRHRRRPIASAARAASGSSIPMRGPRPRA
mgnify:CR=1 FL=1